MLERARIGASLPSAQSELNYTVDPYQDRTSRIVHERLSDAFVTSQNLLLSTPKLLVRLAFETVATDTESVGAYAVYLEDGQRVVVYQRSPREFIEVPIPLEGELDHHITQVRRKHFMVMRPLAGIRDAEVLLQDPMVHDVLTGDMTSIERGLRGADPSKLLRIYSVAVACEKYAVALHVLKLGGSVFPLTGEHDIRCLMRYGTFDQLAAVWRFGDTIRAHNLRALVENSHLSIDEALSQLVLPGTEASDLLLTYGCYRRVNNYVRRFRERLTYRQIAIAWRRFPRMRGALAMAPPGVILELQARGVLDVESSRLLKRLVTKLDADHLTGLAQQSTGLALRLVVQALRLRTLLKPERLVARHRRPEAVWECLDTRERHAVIGAVAAKPRRQARVLRAVVASGTGREMDQIGALSCSGGIGWDLDRVCRLMLRSIRKRAIVPYRSWIPIVDRLNTWGFPRGEARFRCLREAVVRCVPELVGRWVRPTSRLNQRQRVELFVMAVDGYKRRVLEELRRHGALPHSLPISYLAGTQNDWALGWLSAHGLLPSHIAASVTATMCSRGCLTSYRYLNKADAGMKGFKVAGRALVDWQVFETTQELEDELYKCFLNSNVEDWMAWTQQVPKQTGLGQLITRLRSEIETAGSLIGRFSSPEHQREVQEEYGRVGVSYEAQQRRYARDREAVYQRLLQAMKERDMPLVEAYQLLMEGRGLEPSGFKNFRVCQNFHQAFRTPIVSSDMQSRGRYRLFYPVVIEELRQRIIPSWESHRRSFYDHTIVLKGGLAATRMWEVAWDGDQEQTLIWEHTSTSTLVELQDRLSDEFEQIKGRQQVDLPALKKAIGLFYARLSHAALTRRGNAQYALELHRLLYELHGYQVAPPSRQAALPDCFALSCTPDHFVEKYYSRCFAKFSETGDIIKPLINK